METPPSTPASDLSSRSFMRAYSWRLTNIPKRISGTSSPVPAAGHPCPQKALLDERLHDIHHPGGFGPRTEIDHSLRGLEREPAFEHRALRPRRCSHGFKSSQEPSIVITRVSCRALPPPVSRLKRLRICAKI